MKPHRLSKDYYIGFAAIAFTCCVKNRTSVFVSHRTFLALEQQLLESLHRYFVEAHVYLFMPDHAHLLLQGLHGQSNVYECMLHFKQRSGFWMNQHRVGHWQKDFFDHIIRKDEDLEKHVRYILANPVRKGFVQDWKAYPFKGSTLYNFDLW